MFEQFYISMQQDIKLFVFFPVLCAVFRGIFIYTYKPYSLKGKWKVVKECFRFGFWWGMDFNAYVFLFSLLLITLPGLVFPYWYSHGNFIRLLCGTIYAVILYAAFVGKMIFYFQFHDTFNGLVLLGRKANKRNLIDVFFNQYHGWTAILGAIPYTFACWFILTLLVRFPSAAYPHFSLPVLSYGFNVLIVLAAGLGFYFFRYGGTLIHDDKPEWDTIPDIVKNDVFLSKAAMDDLVALEYLTEHPMNDSLKHTDEQDMQSFETAAKEIGVALPIQKNPVYMSKRIAKGAIIKPPSHIFLIVGESYGQNYVDPFLQSLHVADGIKSLMNDPSSAVMSNFLSAGIISRPSIVSLMSGIFDAGLELNEREAFWRGTVPTSLPVQLRKLGYHSSYWYGGSLAHGNFQHFCPACGFDRAMAATDFCGPKAPMSWVGVYDGVFLDKTAELIEQDEVHPLQFHFVYTTSNHGPYKMNLEELGFDTERIMPDAPDDVKHNKGIQSMMGTFWYSDQAISNFIKRMKRCYKDSLFIFTGDHGGSCGELQHTSLMQRTYTFRELHCPVFMMQHPDITQDVLAGNRIGGHMNIMPTIMELIGPAGFEYYSLVPPLTEPLSRVVTPYHWLTSETIGDYTDAYYQMLAAVSGEQTHTGNVPYIHISAAERNLSAYLLRHPELLKEADRPSVSSLTFSDKFAKMVHMSDAGE
ncbi:LTA synthase family protein [Megasphaera sueciensis]|uniref:LTA synthase family protein n=1 Tax=Megasphaera sueciensis TaxID=349094 RepID=UPI003D048EE8